MSEYYLIQYVTTSGIHIVTSEAHDTQDGVSYMRTAGGGWYVIGKEVFPLDRKEVAIAAAEDIVDRGIRSAERKLANLRAINVRARFSYAETEEKSK